MGDIFDRLQCEPMAFVENLKYMGIGMLGIFVVIGIIVCVTSLLNHMASSNKNKE